MNTRYDNMPITKPKEVKRYRAYYYDSDKKLVLRIDWRMSSGITFGDIMNDVCQWDNWELVRYPDHVIIAQSKDIETIDPLKAIYREKS